MLEWSPLALDQLRAIALEFYGTHELEVFRETIRHLLSLNPRSNYWKTTYGSYYYLRFDRATMHFTFDESGARAVVDRVAETQMDAKR